MNQFSLASGSLRWSYMLCHNYQPWKQPFLTSGHFPKIVFYSDHEHQVETICNLDINLQWIGKRRGYGFNSKPKISIVHECVWLHSKAWDRLTSQTKKNACQGWKKHGGLETMTFTFYKKAFTWTLAGNIFLLWVNLRTCIIMLQ